MAQGRSRQTSVGSPRKINKREARVLEYGAVQKEHALYDFSVDAGAIGDVSFRTKLPANAVITNIYSSELANVTSGGSATVQLKAGSTNLSDAIAIADFTGTKSHALASSATAIKLTAESELLISIATAALTAGKIKFTVQYFIEE